MLEFRNNSNRVDAYLADGSGLLMAELRKPEIMPLYWVEIANSCFTYEELIQLAEKLKELNENL